MLTCTHYWLATCTLKNSTLGDKKPRAHQSMLTPTHYPLAICALKNSTSSSWFSPTHLDRSYSPISLFLQITQFLQFCLHCGERGHFWSCHQNLAFQRTVLTIWNLNFENRILTRVKYWPWLAFLHQIILTWEICVLAFPSNWLLFSLNISLSICLSVCLSISLSVCLSASLSISLSVCLSVSLSVFLSVSLSLYLLLCLSLCLSVTWFPWQLH